MSTASRFLAYNPNDVKPGWVAFFVVMILLVATFLLWVNMNKQMKKINVPHAAAFKSGRTGAEASPGQATEPREPGDPGEPPPPA